MGANRGFIYIRAEYPLAIKRLQIAIDQGYKLGVLGKNIFDKGFDFDIEIRIGAGAFVCGEETALMRSIEGRRGQPMPRPPFPAQRGLWGKPTNINNVETWSTCPSSFAGRRDGMPPSAPRRARARRSSRSPAKSPTPAWPRCPSARRCAKSYSKSAAAPPKGKKFKAVQIGRPVRRRHPGQSARHARGIRGAPEARLHHGLGRHGRHGRGFLHGGCGAVFPRILLRRILRQMPAVPRWHQADAQPAGKNLPRRRRAGGHRPARSRSATSCARPASAAWARPRRTRC